MKAVFLNPFVASVVQVVQTLLGEAPAKGNIFIRERSYNCEGAAVIIGITGPLRGQVVMAMSEDCAKGIAAKMMMEDCVDELDEYALSALGEMANMISANATIGLSEAGYICDITPPAMLTGESFEITCPDEIKTVVIPLILSMGPMELNLTVSENNTH